MMLLRNLFAAICIVNLAAGLPFADAAVAKATDQKLKTLTLKEKLKILEHKQNGKNEHFIFDLPVTYNHKVSYWISYFQTRGKNFFRNWLEKSSKYMPYIQAELKKAGLPGDLGLNRRGDAHRLSP